MVIHWYKYTYAQVFSNYLKSMSYVDRCNDTRHYNYLHLLSFSGVFWSTFSIVMQDLYFIIKFGTSGKSIDLTSSTHNFMYLYGLIHKHFHQPPTSQHLTMYPISNNFPHILKQNTPVKSASKVILPMLQFYHFAPLWD